MPRHMLHSLFNPAHSWIGSLHRAVTSLALACVLATAAHAQLAPDWTALRVGGIVGWNRSTFTDAVAGSDPQPLNGFMGGITLLKPFGAGFALRGELLTSRKGSVWSTTVQGGPGQAGLELTYLDVPVMLAYEASPIGGVRPHLYAGPSFDLQTACRTRLSAQGQTSYRNCNQTTLDIKSAELAAVAGAGIGVQVTRDIVGTLGARYTNGFSKVLDGSNAKNRLWTFYLGVEMLKRK